MPVETDSLLNRPVMDIALYFFVQGQQAALHTISDESACDTFSKKCGPLFRSPNSEALRKKVARMKEEELEAKRTKE